MRILSPDQRRLGCRSIQGPTFILLLALATFGCGEGSRHHISGKVNFKGKPVAAGRIYFDPDVSKKNEGPGGYADIKDGYFDTSKPGGKGGPGGPTIVRINGLDGAGKPLFNEYKTPVDLGTGSTSKDFDVPESAAKGLVIDSGPPP